MNIFDNEDESFKKIKEDMRNCKRMISKLDVAEAIGSAVASVTSAMVLTNDAHHANLMGALDTKRSLDRLFPKESQDEEEKCKEASDTELELKRYDDLKCRLFLSATIWFSPFQTEVENQRTAEIRRSAKHTALLSLISEAGLMGEYHEWLCENGYNSEVYN